MKECPACGRKYSYTENPHYQASDDTYVCTKEKASEVHGR